MWHRPTHKPDPERRASGGAQRRSKPAFVALSALATSHERLARSPMVLDHRANGQAVPIQLTSGCSAPISDLQTKNLP
jgi:hypothetical protein